MKNIRLLALELNNFKLHDHFALDAQGCNCAIYGDNAAGKTSIYDALTWLLFGKDSKGNGEKSVDIKPLAADGSVRDHQAVTSVEATFRIEEETQIAGVNQPATPAREMRLKRTLQEVWSTKRGSTTASFDGNTSEYFIDGVPMRKIEFERRVGELVGEETFRMLTGVAHFAAEVDWKERRRILFGLAGTATDAQILAESDEFAALRKAAGDLPLDDFKKKLAAQKKGLNGVRDTTPAKLESLTEIEAALAAYDFAAARDELACMESRKQTVLEELAALKQDTALLAKEKELAVINAERSRLSADNREYRARAQGNAPDPIQLERQIARVKKQIADAESTANRCRRREEECTIALDRAREQWGKVSAEAFSAGVCPTCGQPLPEAERARTEAAFGERKQERLAALCRDAEDKKVELADLEQRVAEADGAIPALREEVARLERELTYARDRVIPDMPQWAEKDSALETELREIHAVIDRMRAAYGDVERKYRAELNALNEDIRHKQEILAREKTLQDVRQKMAELREDAQKAAAELEQIESLLVAIEEFTRYKVSYVEGSINGKFRLANFRLFREQANGGIEDRCDVTYRGIPYQSLNNGAKINVGIDIINTLSAFYGVRVPLFIDNAESVTALEDADTQLLRLVVSQEDKELRCEYENR